MNMIFFLLARSYTKFSNSVILIEIVGFVSCLYSFLETYTTVSQNNKQTCITISLLVVLKYILFFLYTYKYGIKRLVDKVPNILVALKV